MASPEALQQIVFWLFGSLQRSSMAKVGIVAIVLAGVLPMLLADAWRLTALRLGDERALALGVRVDRLRLRCFVVVSLLTGAAVAFVGTIGFIGLVAPHVARMLVGEDQRHLLPASAVFGALLLSLASVASKLILPGTRPCPNAWCRSAGSGSPWRGWAACQTATGGRLTGGVSLNGASVSRLM